MTKQDTLKINEFYNGNCIELVKQIADNSIDCVITSPPYFNSLKKYQRGTGYHYTQDIGEPLYLIYDICELLRPKLKDEAALCINLGYSYGETGVMRPFDIINRIRTKLGYFVSDLIVWHKSNPIPLQKRLTNATEYIFVLSKTPKVKYYTTKYTHNVIKSGVASSGLGHSAVYPEDLPNFCLQNFTKENDLVLDCFMGSGTTALSCVKSNRNFIGFEINNDYIELSKKRIKPFINQKKLF
jgi:DNA modification methylase